MKRHSNFHPELVKHQASGGFKLPLDTLTKYSKTKPQPITNPQNITTQESIYPTKNELLDRMGFDPNVKEFPIDFEELQEGGAYGLNSRRELGDYVIKDLEKKIEKMKMGRKDLEQKVFEQRKLRESQARVEDVIIYEGDERKQYASHILSTLEVNSVENLEALIVSFINLKVYYY